MGNREDLLEGAKRCLLEKGYRATTARDIAPGQSPILPCRVYLPQNARCRQQVRLASLTESAHHEKMLSNKEPQCQRMNS